MYLQEVRLQNFKRFTDLTIDLGQTDAPYRLVLLIGANGSGKSSVFDAFEICSDFEKKPSASFDNQYYTKDNSKPYRIVALSSPKVVCLSGSGVFGLV